MKVQASENHFDFILLLDTLLFLIERIPGLVSIPISIRWLRRLIRSMFKERISKIGLYGFIPFLFLIPFRMTPIMLDCSAEQLLFKSFLNTIRSQNDFMSNVQKAAKLSKRKENDELKLTTFPLTKKFTNT